MSELISWCPCPRIFSQWGCDIPMESLLRLGEGGVRLHELFLADGAGRAYPVPVLNRSQRSNGALANPPEVSFFR